MLKVNDLYGRKVYVQKKARKQKAANEDELKLSRLGKIHMAVFSPDGHKVVGFMIVRPDVVGMIKRDDAFLAWDSFKILEDGTLYAYREDGLDDAARKRLSLDWDSCVMWAGMDAKTEGGKKLGYVSDVLYDEKTGDVQKFFVGDGGVARAIVGSFEVPASMVRGYSKGYMIVDDAAADLELDGGVAAKAGEGYAKAKIKGAEVGKKAGAAASEAVDKGSYAFGRMLGKAKRAIKEATADEAEQPAEPSELEAADVRVSAPSAKLRAGEDERAASPEPKTYAPAPDQQAPSTKKTTGQKPAASTQKKPAAKKAPAQKKPASGSDAAARAVGKQLGKMGKMFSSFKDEFDKASK